MEYKISGKVIDKIGKPLSGIFVEAYDSDIGTDDFLGVAESDSDGQFEIIFDDSAFKGLLERRPDEYLVIRDTMGFYTKLKFEVRRATTNFLKSK